MGDYYDILGVSKNSDKKTIKKAYRKASLKWHPDKNNSEDAKEKFQEINEAYAVLSDEDKRKIYDVHGKDGLENNGRNVNPDDIFNSFFGGGNSFGGGNPFGGMGFNMGGMFSSNGANRMRRKGPNKQISIELKISDMMNGVEKKFAINRLTKCPKCNASGLKPGHTENTCSSCNGSGQKIIRRSMGMGMITQQISVCNECNGKGKIVHSSSRCATCSGSKYVKIKTIKEIYIKPGTKEGENIILKGMGDEREEFVEPGDIIIIFTTKNEETMKRVGNNLEVTIVILLSDALCGLSMSFNHPNGKTILLNYDEVIKPNKKYRVIDLGFKHNGIRGDLIIDFNIIFPDIIDDQRTELIKKLLPKRKKTGLTNNNNLVQYNITKCDSDYLEHSEFNNNEFQEENYMPTGPECVQQ